MPLQLLIIIRTLVSYEKYSTVVSKCAFSKLLNLIFQTWLVRKKAISLWQKSNCKCLWSQFIEVIGNEKVKNGILGRAYYCNSCFCLWGWASIFFFFLCTREVLEWLFEELLKYIKYTDIYFKRNSRFILFWFMEFSGTLFGRSNRYTGLRKRSDYGLELFSF